MVSLSLFPDFFSGMFSLSLVFPVIFSFVLLVNGVAIFVVVVNDGKYEISASGDYINKTTVVNLIRKILPDLNAKTKGMVLSVLYDYKLICDENPAVGFEGISWSGTDIMENHLDGINIRNVDFQKSCLIGANLERSCFSGCDLRRSVFRNANLKGSNMREANLQNANFSDAKLANPFGNSSPKIKIINIINKVALTIPLLLKLPAK